MEGKENGNQRVHTKKRGWKERHDRIQAVKNIRAVTTGIKMAKAEKRSRQREEQKIKRNRKGEVCSTQGRIYGNKPNLQEPRGR